MKTWGASAPEVRACAERAILGLEASTTHNKPGLHVQFALFVDSGVIRAGHN
jgi:hypothetical protein